MDEFAPTPPANEIEGARPWPSQHTFFQKFSEKTGKSLAYVSTRRYTCNSTHPLTLTPSVTMSTLTFCQSPGCPKSVVALGALLCEHHMHMATLPNIDPRTSADDAFRKALSRATRCTDAERPHCWIVGRVDARGYPYPILRNGRQVRPHRIVLEQMAPPAHDTDTAEWTCGHRDCINPAHLRWTPYVPVAKRPVVRPDAKPRNPTPNARKTPRRPEDDDPIVVAERRKHHQRKRQYARRLTIAEQRRAAELAEVL